ncbi:hypothetical protein CR205_06025 [Alteribacter lacisalsi]|uniref:EAL domain-containing protein n=1 Tax=Alteribacter lacisalsi TaxID=2045244 RepID=A0A2W0HB93_9BACI|nr:EAL domain-containing protein [Alteribacter lacisalsi]PYZ98151.1 hypothetical protein CR205_06025 [Alteribacter lacisalsi]
MDPLEVIQKKEHAAAFYQPVISSDAHAVNGYEVLGMLKNKERTEPLGGFFRDPLVPAEYKWEIDQRIYEQAFSCYVNSPGAPFLFLNVHAGVLYELDVHEQFLAIIDSFKDQGLSKSKIVLQFRQNDFKGDPESFGHLLKFFTTSGLKVAIDDLGRHGSDLDLLSKLEPDLLKIDLMEIGNHESAFDYRNVLDALAVFSKKIGASLMFKGIEDFHHLYLAWRHGGQFMEGNYLMRPADKWVSPEAMTPSFKEKIKSFIVRENRRLQDQIAFVLEVDTKLIRLEKDLPLNAGKDHRAVQVAKALSAMAFRVYSCDRFGYQLTCNWIKDIQSGWTSQEEAKGKNWSWRSYFLENLAQMEGRKAGILSDMYRDIETNELIRTYSYPLGENEFIFIDLDPSFLYERDWLM